MWGSKHGIAPAALLELEALLGVAGRAAMPVIAEEGKPGSEARTQSQVRLEAAKLDILLWRNNLGAFKPETGGFVRYGLANESPQMNDKIKSSDLIGIRSKIITPAMIGSKVGIFTAREMKEEGWHFHPNDAHERAQKTFIDLVNSYGGDACFATGAGTL
jgi:hypothetical protein